MHSLERIGRYRLDRRLGSGGFGVVWLAHDDVLEATVAVKVLSDNWVDHLDVRERFLSEARLLRRAASGRVVQVYDIGELPDGRPYFVMEYADDGTLADLVGDGPLPTAEALRLTALAARGAADLHEAGIVHRDIKPSNVLLRSTSGGSARVLLADLGLAKSLAQASGLTLAAGSVGYRPPEQAEPGSGIDARADVYSLGALGYHLVTGSVPGPPGRIVRPDRLRGGLHRDVQRALLRAMEPDRERRWPTALSFADELDRLAGQASGDGRAHEDGQGRGGGQAGHRPRRGRRAAVLSALAAVVLLGAAGVTYQQLTKDTGARTVRVTDASGRVAVEVPDGWARQVRDSGWNPGSLGLRKGTEPGLAVADDLSEWQDLGSTVDGAFIGLSEHGDVASEVAGISHASCHYDGRRTYSGERWHGLMRTWSDCPGGGTVTEAGLTSADGDAQPQVYAQIRRGDAAGDTGTADGSTVDRVLDSIRIGS
ncbi:serine/threonine-protein kinase [Streptomyces sp. NPDC059785]|uniref:serine/threonine-protein kinase n=1 Tax=unclassified Streptomyces TaxID=2593676 RepID=UPI003655883E